MVLQTKYGTRENMLSSANQTNESTNGVRVYVDSNTIPQSQEKPTEGVVVSMGPGKTHPETGVPVDLPCAVGDKVRLVGRRLCLVAGAPWMLVHTPMRRT